MKLTKQIKIVYIVNIRSSFASHLKSEISFGTSFIMQKLKKCLHRKRSQSIIKSSTFIYYTYPIWTFLCSSFFSLYSRFTKDIETVDTKLPLSMQMFMYKLLGVISTIVVISMSSPYFLIVVLPLGIVYTLIQVCGLKGLFLLAFYIPVLVGVLYTILDCAILGHKISCATCPSQCHCQQRRQNLIITPQEKPNS